MLEFMSRGKLYCAVALLAVAMAFAGVAVAAPPSNVKVTESGGRITATWNEPGILNVPLAAEIARSPKTASDGSFSSAGKIRTPLGEVDVEYTSPVLPNGIWYIHIGAYELGEKCDVDDEGNLTCPPEWSPTVTVRIGPGSGPAVRDTVTGFQTLRVAKLQKAAKMRVQASMAEKGTITVRGTVSVPNAAKVYKLRPVSAKVDRRQDRHDPGEALKAGFEGGQEGDQAGQEGQCQAHDRGQGRRRQQEGREALGQAPVGRYSSSTRVPPSSRIR